jgi:hypothetical protein
MNKVRPGSHQGGLFSREKIPYFTIIPANGSMVYDLPDSKS